MQRVLRFQSPELPSLAEIEPYYRQSVDAGWFSNNGPCVRQLERRCSDFIGLEPAAVTCSNATAGLMIALRAAVGEPTQQRKFVAMPSFTFVASAAAVSWSGWTPLFLDVDEQDWQVSRAALNDLGERIGDVAGVMLGSTFGCGLPSSRRGSTEALLRELGVPVVVDSAAGFGATDDDGTALGANGTLEVFSFHATKPFAIGEGGLLTSRSSEVLETARNLANFGFNSVRQVQGPIGLNAKMSELHAATGLAVLDRFSDVLEHRRAAALWLHDEFRGYGISAPSAAAGSTFQFLAVRMPSHAARQRLLERADQQGVEVRVYFDPPMHRVISYRDAPTLGALPVTQKLVQEIVCLPMSNSLTSSDAERIRDLVVSAARS